jgi:hypothetical protein
MKMQLLPYDNFSIAKNPPANSAQPQRQGQNKTSDEALDFLKDLASKAYHSIVQGGMLSLINTIEKILKEKPYLVLQIQESSNNIKYLSVTQSFPNQSRKHSISVGHVEEGTLSTVLGKLENRLSEWGSE